MAYRHVVVFLVAQSHGCVPQMEIIPRKRIELLEKKTSDGGLGPALLLNGKIASIVLLLGYQGKQTWFGP